MTTALLVVFLGCGPSGSDPVDADGDRWPAELDCADDDAAVHPGAAELCDGVDTDCDGVVDEDALDGATWYVDGDGDGYGGPAPVRACVQPDRGHVPNGEDCDDRDASVFPWQSDGCDGRDEDCDSLVDENPPSWFADADDDGFGDPNAATATCDPPPGAVADASDCDDARPAMNPDGVEVCGDGLDNDCVGGDVPCPGFADGLASEGVRLDGDSDLANLGWSVARSGDLDGDGRDDAVVGAPGDCDGASCPGAAWLVGAAPEGPVQLGRLLGEADADETGHAVATGDVDADGVADVLVGAWGNDRGSADAGAAWLVSGPVGSGDLPIAVVAEAVFVGVLDNDQSGQSVALVDVNGDGRDDVVVGTPNTSATGFLAGAAYLFFSPVSGSKTLGGADVTLFGRDEEDKAGGAVASAGDVDGDGLGDLLVGARHEGTGGAQAGAAYLVLAPSADLLLQNADVAFYGPGGSNAGISLAAGDVDGDGRDDVVVGASAFQSSRGVAYVQVGPDWPATVSLDSSGARLEGDVAGDQVGRSAAVVQDLDGDGRGDLVLGAPEEDTVGQGAGAAYVVAGPVEGNGIMSDVASLRILAEAEGDHLGRALSGAGDVDGDGLEDLWLGAYGHESGGRGAGAVTLWWAGLAW